jgi:putative inorganic carbon (HCO3(-)) transporter
MPLENKIERFLLRGSKLPLFLLPFIPIIVTPELIFPYISGKNFAFRIIVEFSFTMYIPLAICYKRYRPTITPLLISILLFTLIVGIADLQGVNPYKSFWSNYERMEGYITILHLALLFLLLRTFFRTHRDWKILLNLLVINGVVVCIYAIINPIPMRITGFTEPFRGRLYGTLGNPPFLASYLTLTVFLTSLLGYITKRFLFKCLYILAIILNLVVIYLTASRAATVALSSGMMVFFIAWLSSTKNELKKRLLIMGLLVTILIIVLILINKKGGFLNESMLYQRFANITSDPSVMSRLETWEMAWNGFKTRPVLGWGQENFICIYTVNKLPLTSVAYKFMDRAHNIIIDWIINVGIVGFASLLIVFWTSIYGLTKLLKKGRIKKCEYLILVTAFLVYFIQNLFIFDTINTYLILFILFAYIDNLNSKEVTFLNEDKKRIGWCITIFIISSGIFLLSFYFVNFKPIRQGYLYREIIESYPDKYPTYRPLKNDLTHALSYQSLADSDIRRQMIHISTHIIRNRLFDIEGAEDFIDSTVKEAEKELRSDAMNLEKVRLIIKFYHEISKISPSFISRFESLIKRYIAVNPEYEWLYFELADVYFLKDDYQSAFNVLNKVAMRAPFNDKKQFKLALAAILASRDEVVMKSLETIRRLRLSRGTKEGYDRETYLTEDEMYLLAQAYVKRKDFRSALEYYKRLIIIKPEEALYHFEIAIIYLALGKREEALKEADRALKLDPLNYSVKVNRLFDSTREKHQVP